ncbi:rhodanese-like domain-containing protein [Massilia sp. H-1]|nr:rhodanese-like domain-containing protein [Massilia sp. H-1]
MKFILDHILLVSIVILSGGALLIPALMPRGKRASTLDVTMLLNRGKNVLVDVRTAEEFAAGHMLRRENMPLADLASRIGELDKSKDKTIIVVCQSGNRSDKAIGLFAKAGFTDVVGLDGGMAAWQAANLPTVK